MTKTIELFNGRDLTGWEDHKNPHLWTVMDGMIVGTSEAGKMSNLSTQTQYGDFELTFEYNADAKVNSGVFLRVSDLDDEVHTGLEIQILDTYGKEPPLEKGDSGALYDMIAPSTNPLSPAGEWNRMRLRCEGPRVEVELNGVLVVEADLDLFDTLCDNFVDQGRRMLVAEHVAVVVPEPGSENTDLERPGAVKTLF